MVTVVTSGVFDLLNARHVAFLKKARALGDRLVVLVNSDKSAIENGKQPVENQYDRCSKVRALRYVDEVKIFSEKTPAEELTYFSSHRDDVGLIYVKSSEYEKYLPEKQVVEELGGVVVFIPEIPGEHTSEMIRRIQERKV